MRMPEPEEDKVTATGGGLCASGLLKLGGVRRSLLKKGLFVLQCALTPPPHLKDASPSQQLFTNSDFQTTLTTLSGSHVCTPVGVVNSPRVSARGLTAHAYV